jgi:hypothetical protein
MNTECWKPIDNYKKYFVSNFGNVLNTKTNRTLKASTDSGGYLKVNLCKNGITQNHKIHRLVANAFLPDPENEDQQCIDHINRQKLDNHYLNLRWCNKSQNAQNQLKRTNTSSQYKGVYFNKPSNKWQAQITINGKTKHIGYFENEKDAARTYNESAILNFGEFANLNIIE